VLRFAQVDSFARTEAAARGTGCVPKRGEPEKVGSGLPSDMSVATSYPPPAGATCPHSTCRRLVLGDGRAESHTPTPQAHAHARMHACRKTRAKTHVRTLPNVRTTHASLLPEHEFCGLLRRNLGQEAEVPMLTASVSCWRACHHRERARATFHARDAGDGASHSRISSAKVRRKKASMVFCVFVCCVYNTRESAMAGARFRSSNRIS
jgi:hypothetical protein